MNNKMNQEEFDTLVKLVEEKQINRLHKSRSAGDYADNEGAFVMRVNLYIHGINDALEEVADINNLVYSKFEYMKC